MIKLENIHKVYQLDKNHSLHALKGINGTRNKHGEIEYPNIEDILREKWSVSINEHHN